MKEPIKPVKIFAGNELIFQNTLLNFKLILEYMANESSTPLLMLQFERIESEDNDSSFIQFYNPKLDNELVCQELKLMAKYINENNGSN